MVIKMQVLGDGLRTWPWSGQSNRLSMLGPAAQNCTGTRDVHEKWIQNLPRIPQPLWQAMAQMSLNSIQTGYRNASPWELDSIYDPGCTLREMDCVHDPSQVSPTGFLCHDRLHKLAQGLEVCVKVDAMSASHPSIFMASPGTKVPGQNSAGSPGCIPLGYGLHM